MDNQSIVYMAYDGDNAGRMCGRAILADNPDALHEISNRIQLGHEVVRRWVEGHGGQFISGGGDEGVFSIPIEAIDSVEELRADYLFATNLTATVGIGNTLSEAGKAMLIGKFRGKDQAVRYEPSLETEIQSAQAKASQGTASAEEKKITEAYLAPEGTDMNQSEQPQSGQQGPESGQHDCPYCQAQAEEQIDDPSHCKYCHDAEQPEPCKYCNDPGAASAGGTDDCQYCQNPKTGDDCPYCAGGTHDATVAGHPDDCKYCADKDQSQPVTDANGGTSQQVIPTAGPTVKNPTTTDSENYAGQDLNQPDLPKPEAIQHNPDGLGSVIDSPTNENVKLDAEGQGGNNVTTQEGTPGVDPGSQQTVEEIAQEIDAIPTYAQANDTPSEVIDAADMATGTGVEGNVSHPDNYADENAPKDLGLGEDEQPPDVTQLMQEGLDNHADNIGREKVIGLVREALEGFKSCKPILEKSKLQAPQLYESSIAMLKAMIEMAKMLGLDQDAETGDGNDPLGTGQPQGTASNDAAGALPAGGATSGAGAGELETAPEGGDPNSQIPSYAPKDSSSANAGPEKKSEGSVGQPVGKLPTKATTEHVARTPQLPNAMNDKGQKKVVDPVSGKIRWIDMKEGKVQSPTGVPVKPGTPEAEGPEAPDGPKVRN